MKAQAERELRVLSPTAILGYGFPGVFHQYGSGEAIFSGFLVDAAHLFRSNNFHKILP
jgi:hypothetical protein